MLNGKDILVLRKILWDVFDDILTNGEYKPSDSDGLKEMKAIRAFLDEYPTLGQLEREGKL